MQGGLNIYENIIRDVYLTYRMIKQAYTKLSSLCLKYFLTCSLMYSVQSVWFFLAVIEQAEFKLCNLLVWIVCVVYFSKCVHKLLTSFGNSLNYISSCFSHSILLYCRNNYLFLQIHFSSVVACIMAFMKHVQFLFFEDILESLEETDSYICFRDSDSESIEVIPKITNK